MVAVLSHRRTCCGCLRATRRSSARPAQAKSNSATGRRTSSSAPWSQALHRVGSANEGMACLKAEQSAAPVQRCRAFWQSPPSTAAPSQGDAVMQPSNPDRKVRPVSPPSCVGMAPLSELESTSSVVRTVSPPSCVGMAPLSELESKYRSVRTVSPPSCDGMAPLSEV
eukprot:scaffold41073_cov63-Phaeocystis_antarctica.AAC.2